MDTMDIIAEDLEGPVRYHNTKMLYWQVKILRENGAKGFERACNQLRR